MGGTPQVYILTWCGDPAALYGSLLTFKTLRTGFPTAPVVVVDNASAPQARPEIQRAAEGCGALFVQLERGVRHEQFLTDVLLRQPSGAAVFIDPDVAFWRSVEDWRFDDALAAGRLIPRFRCDYTRTITHPRLHTSFLWVPDVRKLREEAGRIARERFEWQPLAPSMFIMDGEWQRFDTGASLYAAMPDRLHAFTEEQLSAYDHLFVGSHLTRVAATLEPNDREFVAGLHEKAKAGEVEALRGSWRQQQRFFERRAA